MLASTQSELLYAAPLLGGDDGTEQTIRLLRSLVDDAWKDPVVNRAAIDIIRNAGAQQYDTWAQIKAVYDFAKTFYFVNDPVTKEALRPTRELLKLMAGDCDDINANLMPALLGTIGLETRLVTIAADAETPDSFTHVYCEVFVDGRWYPLDAARPGATFGVAPSQFYRRAWWSLTDDAHGDYPADANGTLAGYSPRGVRGLAGVASDLGTVFVDASGILRSVSGQAVQPLLGPTIGPGGAAYVTPGVNPSMSTVETVALLALLGGLIWWLA